MATIILAGLSSACQSGGDNDVSNPKYVTFASGTLSLSTASPGDMLAIEISGSKGKIDQGVFVRFTAGTTEVVIPAMHVGEGKAYVMVPALSTAVDPNVELSLVDIDGVTRDTHPQLLTVTGFDTTLPYTRTNFDAALGQGLSRFTELAIETVDALENDSYMPAAQAATVRAALNQQVTLLASVAFYNDNLSDAELAMAEQMLDNTGVLDLIAAAGGVTLNGSGSQASPLSSIGRALIESALLKADFASLLIGEIRGALNLIAWVGTQLSTVPVIGTTAQNVATWATGLSATLVTSQDLINTMIPCDLVQITSPYASLNVPLGGSADVRAIGRFETQDAFNQAMFTQYLSQWVLQASSLVTSQMSIHQWFTSYIPHIQQIASMVPGWINSWLAQNGYISTSVVPGQSYTVFSIPNFELDMSQYRFDVAGIVGNLLNLPYGTTAAILNWIGIGLGSPVGGFEGVAVGSGALNYNPTGDRLEGVSKGSTTATHTGVVCQKAGGWWAQWGFYAIHTTKKSITVNVQ
ncbi:MAG: hypothetical protein KDB90_10295 [Planctomycetes bacterium]|nr:hypothetical protein [Planctomycetota bacterium]